MPYLTLYFIEHGFEMCYHNCVKFIFKFLLIVFVWQSTWAVAAQYCQHEEDSKVNHIGHHSHKHIQQSNNDSDLNHQKPTDTNKSGVDADCPYCHLSSIKSMLTDLPVINVEIESVVIIDIDYSYPEIIPTKPERPNWKLAV
jgi:hypothetical protein